MFVTITVMMMITVITMVMMYFYSEGGEKSGIFSLRRWVIGDRQRAIR